jgi:hypothetical protein
MMECMDIWQGVAMDSLKYHSDPPCSTLLPPPGRQPLKREACPAGRVACGLLLPFWTPHAVRLEWKGEERGDQLEFQINST